MSYPQVLASLTPREAIADAVYRAVIGCDRNDTALFNSALTQDVTIQIKAGEEGRNAEGLDIVRAYMLGGVGPMDTTHTISNIRVDVKDGADTASLTCYALAQHCPQGRGLETDGPKYLVGGEYRIDVVRDEVDGLWKIKKWFLDVVWRQGDASVMPGMPSSGQGK